MSSYNSINKEIKDLNLNEKLALLRKWEPRLFLKMAGSFKGINDINLSKEISSAAIEAPSIFISQAKNFKNINGFDLAKEIIKAAEREPSDFLLKASDFKDVENINLAEEISKAAEREPEFFIACNPILFENIKNFDLVHEVKQALKKESGGIFSAAPKLKDIKDLNLKEEIVKAAEINPGYFLDEASNLKWINGLNLKEEIVKAAGKDPESFLDVVGSFKDILEESEKLNLIEQSFKIFPEGIINHRDLLNRIENPAIESNKLLKEIINPQLLLLFHKMVNNDLSKDEASNIINNPNLLYKNLIEIKSIPDHLGSVSVENKLKDLSLRIIQQINSLHERPDIERFKSIENLDAKELYTTMVYGEQEIFTSSFNGLFNRLISKIDRKKGGIGGKELLDQVGENKFRTFIKECTGFNRLDEFLLTMDKSDADNLLIKIVQNLDFVQDGLGQAVTVADIFGNIQDKETIKLLQNQIKIEYEKISSNPNSNEKDQVIYGLLSSMFKNNTQINQDWFLNISKEYPIDKVTEVKSQELFNENGVCVQKYCFYESGDKDGVYSFDNFVNTYKNDPLWNIDRSHEGFIIITGKNGNKTVEIYANIPKVESRGMAGIDEMNEFLEKNKSKINVYTYRGHSFGFEIDGDISKASIVNVGSCGGYNNLSEVLAKSPHAQIISTQGTGSKFVNDPTLYRANKLILSGRDILWNNFVESLPDSLKKNKNFKDYVFPDKNQGMMFIKAYYKKLKEKE